MSLNPPQKLFGKTALPATVSRDLRGPRRASAVAASVVLLLGSLTDAHALAPPQPPARAAVTAKLLRYSQRIVRQYDINHDGRLQPDEWQAMKGEPSLADLNHDRQITAEEFAQYIANYSAGRAIRLSTPGSEQFAQAQDNEASLRRSNSGEAQSETGQGNNPPSEVRRDLKFSASLPAGVPPWFIERDTDGDGQLTLSEFSPKLHKAEVDDFNRFDLNHDGILTVREYLGAGKDVKNKAAGSPSQPEQGRPTGQ